MIRAKAAVAPLVVTLLVAGCVGPVATPTAGSTGRLTTIAGGGSELGDGGAGTAAGLCNPTDVAVDPAGNVYVSDAGVFCTGPGGHRIRRIDRSGIITTVAGSGVAGFSGDGGPATSAQLYRPFAIAIDRDGNMYIADTGNGRIRKVDANGIISTIAGTGENGSSGDGGPATAAQIRFSLGSGGLALDDAGSLYFADGATVRKIDRSGTITTVAGTAGTEAFDVAIDPDGDLYVSDRGKKIIRRIARDGMTATIAGGGDRAGDSGVAATSVALSTPWGLALGPNRELFFVEHHASVVRKVSADGLVTTVAGIYHRSSGGRGLFNGEEGPATHIYLNEPIGLVVDAAGILYIADTFNKRVRAVHFAN